MTDKIEQIMAYRLPGKVELYTTYESAADVSLWYRLKDMIGSNQSSSERSVILEFITSHKEELFELLCDYKDKKL